MLVSQADFQWLIRDGTACVGASFFGFSLLFRPRSPSSVSAAIAGVSRRKAARTTFRDERVRPACDLVDRNFYADEPDRLWVADITYVPTWAGFLYLAVVLDAFSRRIVGWAMGHNLKAQLVLDALNMALTQRRPANVIHHSDQGSQYTSIVRVLQLYRKPTTRCRKVSVCRRVSGLRSLRNQGEDVLGKKIFIRGALVAPVSRGSGATREPIIGGQVPK